MDTTSPTIASFEQHPISLKFKDEQLEQEIKRYYEDKTQQNIRPGLIFSLITWLIGIGILYFVLSADFMHLAGVIIVTLFPYFLFIIHTTYHDRYHGHYQWMIASTNALAGLLLIYVCSFLPSGEIYTLIFLNMTAYFGGYAYRIQYVYIAAAALSYIIVFQVYLLVSGNLPTEQLVLFSSVLWITAVFVIWLEYNSERTDRVLFLQQKIIKEQKKQIQEEQKKSESLLQNMLPASIAHRLKNKELTIADRFESISVLFADIVGFTKTSQTMPPETLVALLNNIFCRFDEQASLHGVEKIKTIGDAYMVASGLPEPTKNHAESIADFALSMKQQLAQFNAENNQTFNIRIGIHTGSAVAGVIGAKKFVYDIWGDTVNTASRMESHGIPGEIQISQQTYEELKEKYRINERGTIDVKGKGEMKTYILQEKH